MLRMKYSRCGKLKAADRGRGLCSLCEELEEAECFTLGYSETQSFETNLKERNRWIITKNCFHEGH